MPSESEVDAEEAAQHRSWMRDMEEKMSQQKIECAAGRADLAAEQRKCVQDMKDEGNSAFKNGNIAEAIARYSEAIQMDYHCGDDDKMTAVLYSNRAAAFLKQAEVGHTDAWADAERDCRRAIERAPTAKVYHRLARALHEGLGRPPEAFACLAEALLLEPANGVVRTAVSSLRAEHADLAVPEHTLERMRRRRAQRAERKEQEATAFDEALALLLAEAPSASAE